MHSLATRRVRRAHHIVSLVEETRAGPAKKRRDKKRRAKKAAQKKRTKEKKQTPEEYRDTHGKCPRGFNWNGLEEKCLPTELKTRPTDVPPKDDEAKLTPEERKQQRETKKDLQQKQRDKKQKERQSPERKKKVQEKQDKKKLKKDMRNLRNKNIPLDEKHGLLDELSKKDPAAYKKEVDRLREDGTLPTRENAELMSQVDGIKGLLEQDPGLRDDPKKLKGLIKQQAEQAAHEERTTKSRRDMLNMYDRDVKLAKLRGEDPPKFDFEEFMLQSEQLMGRPLPGDAEKNLKILQENDDLFGDLLGDGKGTEKESKKRAKEGARQRKFNAWLDRLFEPLPTWTPFKASGSVEDRMKVVQVLAVLDVIAQELEKRKAPALATLVDAEASGLPEADQMPDVPKAEPWDNDWRFGTSDMGEDLGFPPYEKARPKVRGDEPAAVPANTRVVIPAWIKKAIKASYFDSARLNGTTGEIVVLFSDAEAATKLETRINISGRKRKRYVGAYSEKLKNGKTNIRILV